MQVVVITGAASGIGRSTALGFARRGAKVHGVDIDEDGLTALGIEVVAAGGQFAAHLVDCRDPQALVELADAVIDEDGHVDVVHNNAGVGMGKPITEMEVEDWEWIRSLNLDAVYHGIRAFVPFLLERGGGTIVNTASIAGLGGFPTMSAYCATKFAVVGLSEALDLELAPQGVRVIAVCPGIIDTNIIRAGRISAPHAGVDPARVWERGSDPDVVAKAILRAVDREIPLVVTPPYYRMMTDMRRLSRRLYKRVTSLIVGQANARANR